MEPLEPRTILSDMTKYDASEARAAAATRRAEAARDGHLGPPSEIEQRSAADVAAWAVPAAAAVSGLGREYLKQRGETERTRIAEAQETARERIRHEAEEPPPDTGCPG